MSKPRTRSDYKVVGTGRAVVYLHRIRAEQALGKLLPVGAIVHHADGSKADDAPLVICQDQAYHLDLHRRMRVKAAGGNPWTDKICSGCKLVFPRTDFQRDPSKRDGCYTYCRLCNKLLSQQRRAAHQVSCISGNSGADCNS